MGSAGIVSEPSVPSRYHDNIAEYGLCNNAKRRKIKQFSLSLTGDSGAQKFDIVMICSESGS